MLLTATYFLVVAQIKGFVEVQKDQGWTGTKIYRKYQQMKSDSEKRPKPISLGRGILKKL